MATARYCKNCGAELADEASFCVSCGASSSVVDMKCPACGYVNPTDSRFCGECGVSLGQPAASGTGLRTAELSMVNFSDAIKLGFKNKVKFSGRSTRAEFWWFYLFSILGFYGLMIILGAVAGISGSLVPLLIGYVAAILIFGIPQLALSSRRLHDAGRSAWWFLIALIPFGGIVLLIWWIQKGDSGPNKYGPDPRQPNL